MIAPFHVDFGDCLQQILVHGIHSHAKIPIVTATHGFQSVVLLLCSFLDFLKERWLGFLYEIHHEVSSLIDSQSFFDSVLEVRDLLLVGFLVEKAGTVSTASIVVVTVIIFLIIVFIISFHFNLFVD